MKKIIYILSCWAVAGCQPTLIAEFEDKPVVNCFLEAGNSPILTISKLIAFRDDVEYTDEDVNTLSITITDEMENLSHQMQSIGDGRYENPFLIAQAGHSYSLNFIYNNKTITATTTVPDRMKNVEFSATSIGIGMFSNPIEITWSNNERNYYVIEGFTTSSTPVRGSGTDLPKKFKLDCTQGNSATLESMQFNYLGNYEVSLINILPEYVSISQGNTDTSVSTSIVDVKGNIDGGYGIFTGINRVTQKINVYRASEPF